MNAARQIENATRRLEQETVSLQLLLATRMMRRAALELHYSPDQPRIPAGNTDGGQWTGALGLAHATTRPPAIGVAQGMGRQKFSGVLVRHDYSTTQDVSRCTHYDSRANYTFIVVRAGNYCPNGQLFF